MGLPVARAAAAVAQQLTFPALGLAGEVPGVLGRRFLAS